MATKRNLSIKIENYTFEILNNFAVLNKINISELVRISINEYIKKHSKDVENEEIQRYISFYKMENARKNTRLQMRKATFIGNVKRKMIKLIQDGLSANEFHELIIVWSEEAEANGMEKEQFLSVIYGYLKNQQGGGIYEN